MQRTTSPYPLLTDPGLITVVEQAIAHQKPSELWLSFRQRLAWLRQIISG